MEPPNGFYDNNAAPFASSGRRYVKSGRPLGETPRPASPPSRGASSMSGKKIKPVWIACGSLAALGAIAALCILILGVGVWTETIPLPNFLKETEMPASLVVPSQPVLITESAATEIPASPSETQTETQTETPAQVTATQEPPTLIFEGISLTADSSLGTNVTVEKVPGASGTDLPPWELIPSHVKISFNDYPLQDKFHQAYILVFPLQDYYAISPASKDTAEQLKNILAAKAPDPGEAIPFLPEWNAAQFFHPAVKYIDFKNGSGVRFLTMYGQAASPVNNNSLFYCFQGITADGKYYISAVLPANHPSLPADGNDIPNGDYEAFANGFPDYIHATSIMLSAEQDATFTPNLAALDEMMASIEVKPE